MRITKIATALLIITLLAIGSAGLFPAKTYAQAANSATNCDPKSDLLGFPTWYEYLPCDSTTHKPTFNTPDGKHFDPQNVLLIGMAIIDILVRLAGILAIVFIVIGGIKYTTSQGSPESIQNAKNTIIFAVIGLILTIVASGIVSFIARSVQK